VYAFLWKEKPRLNRNMKKCDSPASVPKRNATGVFPEAEAAIERPPVSSETKISD